MKSERFRMVQWLALAALFYGLALLAFGSQPQLQTLCWKLGNVTIAAYVGYKIDVHASRKRITPFSSDGEYIRRSIIMAAAMLAVGMGL